MLRVAAAFSSTVLPRAVLGAITASGILSQPIPNAFRSSEPHLVERNIPNQILCRNFSTVTSDELKKVDRELSKALKHEIKSLDPSTIQVPEAPTGFPFEIEDIPGKILIKLKREFEREKVEVEVFDPIYPEEDDGGDGDGEKKQPGKTCCWYPDEARIQLNVNITKEDGEKLMIMLWGVVGYVGYPTRFYVNGVPLKHEMVDFDWLEIIRARGIDDSMAEFLMEYMNRRSDRDRWLTLNKFREFVKA